MTVKELIEALQQFSEDTIVHLEMRGYYDSEDGLLSIQGDITSLNYYDVGWLHIIAECDIAKPVSE